MRVLWIVPGGVDASGAERVTPVLLWHIERIAARHRLHVVALQQHSRDTEYDLLGAHIHSLAPRGFAATALAIRRLARDHGPFDLLHAYRADRGASIAVLLAKATRRPAIVTLFGGELAALPDIAYGGSRTMRQRLQLAAVLRAADAVTCESRFIAQRAASRGIEAIEIPLGVDRRVFTPREVEPAAPPWRLLHVGSINRVKDQSTLLRALQHVRRLEPAVTLDIVGEDTLDGALVRLAQELQLADAVRFHGVQRWTAMPRFYHAAHALVMSSRHEAAPVALLEAACCGVPVVGTRVGYLNEWEHAGRALAVAPGDDRALAEAILRLLRQASERREIAARAREWAAANDADASARTLEALYGACRRRG